MAHGAAADERLGDLADVDRRLHAGGHAPLLQGVLEGEGVDHRGEHAHVVAGHAVDAAVAGGEAADDVAAADDDRHLDPEVWMSRISSAMAATTASSMPNGCVAHQGLAGDLEEDPAVLAGRPPGRMRSAFGLQPLLPRLGHDFGGEVVLALLDPSPSL